MPHVVFTGHFSVDLRISFYAGVVQDDGDFVILHFGSRFCVHIGGRSRCSCWICMPTRVCLSFSRVEPTCVDG